MYTSGKVLLVVRYRILRVLDGRHPRLATATMQAIKTNHFKGSAGQPGLRLLFLTFLRPAKPLLS